jgi:hypothetical protein
MGGSGKNYIQGEAGNDIIDAGTGEVTVDGGAGDDEIKWNYAPFTQATGAPDLLISGGTGLHDKLTVVAVTQTDPLANNNAFTLTDAGTPTGAAHDVRMTAGRNHLGGGVNPVTPKSHAAQQH